MKRIIQQHNFDDQHVVSLITQRSNSWRADVWAGKTALFIPEQCDLMWVGIINATGTDDDIWHLSNDLIQKNLDKLPTSRPKT